MPLSKLKQAITAYAPPEGKVALAVSGGGDSVAMLRAAVDVIPVERLVVLHVNHGLRAEAVEEVCFVRELSELLGVVFYQETLDLLDKSAPNLQAQARAVRYEALARMANKASAFSVWLAHNSNDVAETFLMRLGKGAGVKGLSSMDESFFRHNTLFERPLLNLSRGELREALSDMGQTWCEDPSNEDEKFLRIRIRKFLQDSENKLLNVPAVTASAHAMARANEALDMWLSQFWTYQVTETSEGCHFSLDAFFALPDEIQLRVIDKCVRWGGEVYPPRSEKKYRLIDALHQQGEKRTLGGVIFYSNPFGMCIVHKEKP